MTKRPPILALLIAFLASSLCGEDLDTFIGTDYGIFKADRPRFITPAVSRCFAWTSDAKDSARYPLPYRNAGTPALTYLGFPVSEAIVRFSGNSVSSIYVSVYNRGDAGEISMEEFGALLLGLDKKICGRTGVSDPAMLKDRLANGMEIYARVWVSGKFAYTLKWSSTGKTKKSLRPEYIQLVIEPFDPAHDPRTRKLAQADKSAVASIQDLRQNVRHDEKGNVWIDNIPMVDQGAKGYCAAAVAERVLNYYGIPVTQHQIAQLAKTDAKTGTTAESMTDALKKVGVKFRVRIRDRYTLVSSVDDIQKIVDRYNRTARKMKRNRCQLVVRGDAVYPDETIASFDPEVYLKVRQSDSAFKTFLRDLHERVDEGLPIVWNVQLGLLPEDKLGPQAKGGHMRLIIGYNDRNGEVLYSDTWGMGHELKSMPAENAWAITSRTLFIDPRQKK